MQALEGVHVAAITPRGDGGDVNMSAMLELVDFLCAAGVQGIALLGSTGEFLSLGVDERVRLTYLAVKRSRIPVLAGVGHSTLQGALHLGREACAAGAAGLLLMPPYFFRYSQADIKEFFLQYSAQIGRSVPVYLYNIPFFTNPIACDTALDLLSTGHFAGIKDSSGEFDYFLRLRALAQEHPFRIMIGNDAIFTRARQAGAHGVISGVACALPELMMALDRATLAGDASARDRLQAMLEEFLGWIDRFPAPVGIRAACAQRGLQVGRLAVPLAPEKHEELEQFHGWFRMWLPSVLKQAAQT